MYVIYINLQVAYLLAIFIDLLAHDHHKLV